MGVAGGPDLIQDGLVLALDASDRNSYVSGSTTWFDLSGLNNSGSLINGPTFNTGSLGSIVFDGINDYVNCGNIMPSTAYTKCVWFYITNNSTNNNLISGGGDGTHYFYPGQSSYLRAGHFQGTELVSDTPFSINTWYHGTVTFSTTSGFAMYQNGVAVGTNPSTATFTGGNVVYVGAYGAGGNLLTGRIGIAQIYNRALSASEITQNYNATKTRFGL
jgi:hypothetical protein